ncbi:Chromobox protein 3 [Orchesella cincta]|uniref:Chromobox protein 3 n=1 Tax=Orchesella cincta TaxID=48709 RepID=A0A1D2N8I4_ORCCI|nr:Chromobox protein 3 [Orchesella cincta]
MGRVRKKGRYEEEDRGDMEVLIAHDPMLAFDSDDDIDLGGGSNRRSSVGSGSSSSRSRSKNRNKKKEKEKEVNAEGQGDGEAAPDGEEIFFVEKIKDKRYQNDRWEFLLQWQGYGPEYDTWEPKENMDCDDLLEEFEAEWNKQPKFRLDFGEQARELIGLAVMNDKPQFLVMYKNSEQVELVPREIVNKYCPGLVIEYYENRQLALLDQSDNVDPDAPPELARE